MTWGEGGFYKGSPDCAPTKPCEALRGILGAFQPVFSMVRASSWGEWPGKARRGKATLGEFPRGWVDVKRPRVDGRFYGQGTVTKTNVVRDVVV